MPQTVVEKIAQAHLVEGPDRPLRSGDFVSIRPRHILTHDNTAAVIKKFKAMGCEQMFDPRQPVFVLDHDIQNTQPENLKKYAAIEAFAQKRGIDFYPAGTGIGHQVMVERGYVLPGSFVVASDSHANMYGALGAVGTPVVRTDAAVVWATRDFWWQIPPTVQVVLEGRLPNGASGKDVIITLCGLYPREVLNCAVEFSGPGVATLSMDARLTIANMSTEWGALVGWFPADDLTFEYLSRTSRTANIEDIRKNAVQPDADAPYVARITLKLDEVSPHVSGPDTVQRMTSLADIEKQKLAIHKAYLVSCVNSRLEDLEAAAGVLRGKKVAKSVKFYVAPASRQVQEQAEQSGVWKTILDSGAIALPAGCGPCIGLGAGVLEPGEVGISATNRNFKGRMGSRDAQCYLASPAVVAASALAGYIRSPQPAQPASPVRWFEEYETAEAPEEKISILPGFPAHVSGRMVFLPQDNLNTDLIYGKDYTYREDMTPEMMARVVLENYDSAFAQLAAEGDILVSGFNFGTGSSREQAVTALKAKGIAAVIAASFSQTYLRNAFNNGLICIEAPAMVKRCKEQFRYEAAGGAKCIVTGDQLDIDFSASTVRFYGWPYRFSPLGSVPQSLVIAGGVEKLVARKLAAKVGISV